MRRCKKGCTKGIRASARKCVISTFKKGCTKGIRASARKCVISTFKKGCTKGIRASARKCVEIGQNPTLTTPADAP